MVPIEDPVTEAFAIVGILSVISLFFFVYLCKKLSINYTKFLVQSFLGFAVAWVLLFVLGVIPLTDNYKIIIGLICIIVGMLVHHQVFGFSILFTGLLLFYQGIHMSFIFNIFSHITQAEIFSDPIFKALYAFWVMMAMFLVRTIVHRRCCVNKIW